MNSLQVQQQAEKQPAQQASLLNLSGREVYADFYDAKTPVFLPDNPLHFKAHKLQILVDRLESQAVKNAAQFNSKNYLEAVDALMECYKQIREQLNDDMDARDMASGGNQEGARTVGNGVAPGVGAGISADNPLTR